MQFVMVIYHGNFPLPGSPGWDALSRSEQRDIYAEYARLNEAMGDALRLPPIAPHTAKTVRVHDGAVQAEDGPYLREGIGGAFVYDVEDMDAAVAFAARIPQARLGGAIEIRPVEKYF
ncbi:MAG: YciI family protein [Hyphomicrobiales bacterium]